MRFFIENKEKSSVREEGLFEWVGKSGGLLNGPWMEWRAEGMDARPEKGPSSLTEAVYLFLFILKISKSNLD